MTTLDVLLNGYAVGIAAGFVAWMVGKGVNK